MPVTEGITASVTLKAAPGFVKTVSVVVAGSAAGTINDAASVGGAAAANAVAGTPAAIGSQVFGNAQQLGLRCGTGITVLVGTGQTIAVEWE